MPFILLNRMKIGATFSDNRPSVAAIGFFDGVHRGHRYLIEQVREAASLRRLAASVVTFPVHPRRVTQPDCQLRLLTTCQEKTDLLAATGVDTCLMLDFTPRLASLSARDFMSILKRRYQIAVLVIGYDHRFGHNRSEGFEDYMHQRVNGTTIPHMNRKYIEEIQMIDWTVQEQCRIVDYLDRKCSQIDAIIARQQEVIEKLKAYKLSILTEAVTKGLNPDVPMKDSGVEWIGEIPEHWDFRKIKNCCLIVDCKNRTPDPDPDGEYIVVRTTCIRDGSFSYEGSYHTNAENFKEWTAKGQPQHGDIFFTREAPMGEACLVPDADNLCMGQRVMFFRPLDGSDPRYILYSIYGPLAREYIDSKNKGSTVGHLKLGQVASLPLFYCPPKEQSEIADYLDKRCGAIDKVVEKKAEIISKLTDYKKSLIYEVVTGKKEV